MKKKNTNKVEKIADIVISLIGIIGGMIILYLLVCWADINNHNNVKNYDYGDYNILVNMAKEALPKETRDINDEEAFIVIEDETY